MQRIVSVTRRFPAAWRATASFERPGVADKWSDEVGPDVTYVVEDCMYSPGQSDGFVDFAVDAPETDGIIYTPVKQDIRPQDTGTYPETRFNHEFDFVVNGWPKQMPYGMAVPIKWAL